MSNERNFRVSINLCLWFNDHRHRARIFVTDNMNTIGDLEKRIENIFNIKNFHLTSQNEYLPSSEDVRILQKDDIVWVMKNDYEQECIPKITTVVATNTENVFKDKKRMMSVTEDYMEQDSLPAKKKKKKKHGVEKSKDTELQYLPEKEPKKKKKHKDNKNCITIDQVSTTEHADQGTRKDKKVKKAPNRSSDDYSTPNTLEEDLCTEKQSNSINITKLLPVLQSHINSYNKKMNTKTNERESTNSSRTSSPFTTMEQQSELYKDSKEPYKCKGKLSSYKKKVSVPTITDQYLQEKKVNIVKIEYLSGGPSHMSELEISKGNGAIKHQNESISTSSSRNTDTDLQNSKVCISEKGVTNSEDYMDQSPEKEESNAGQLNASACKNADIKFILDKDKNDITYSPMSNSLITTDSKTQNKNKSLNNIVSKNEVKITDSEAKKSLLDTTSETLNAKQLNEVDESTQYNPFISNDPLLQIGINNVFNPKINMSLNDKIEKTSLNSKDKSVVPLVKIDLSSNEENKEFELNSTVTIPKVSNNYSEISTSSEEAIKDPLNDVQSEVNNTNLEKTNIDVSTGNNVSLCNQSVYNMENSSKELQQADTSDLNNSTNKTNVFDKNISLVSEKESTSDQNVDETRINSNDNNRDSDTDLTDVLKPLSDTSILSRGSSSFSRRKQLSGIGQLLGELRSNDSLVTGESMDSDYSEFITKRKRKRIRKRKKKNDSVNDDNTSLNDSSIIVSSDYVPKPIRSKACPTIHLKFEEEDGELLKVVDVTKKESQSVEDTESHMETSGIENITIDTIDSDADQPHFENLNIKEEYILKSPLIKNLLPKIGDIIAFKILRITENYTPEISPYIIGKVIEFNSENKIVLYEILNGLEHCRYPKGILSLEEADDSNKQEFAWADIIDPRLLFP